MSKTRNTESGRYAKAEEAKTNPNGTVVENDRRAKELKEARQYVANLRRDESDSMETEAFICGAEAALAYFTR